MRQLKSEKKINEIDQFKKAALALVKNFKTPEDFLEVMTDYLGMIHEYLMQVKNMKVEGSHFEIAMMIRHLTPVWLKGGPDVIDNLAKEMKEEIYDFFGDEPDIIPGMLAALGKDTEGSLYPPETWEHYVSALNGVVEINNCFIDYTRSSQN